MADLLPGGPYLSEISDESPLRAHLPLEYFDDTEADVRTPADWIELGKNGDVFEPIPVRALLPVQNTYSWDNASVLGYDADKNVFEVAVDGQPTTQLPRIFVMFLAEDPDIFAKRVLLAHNLRKETEAYLRYHLSVDCMPPDPGQLLDEAVLQRIASIATSKQAKRCGLVGS